ncbi:nucleic acid-binding protein [Macrolepiota fuliginosa MF-IS2]|uniref:Replication factor A protein 1 n=1 Tax=Macrolepiota fuliginosa MF-IS2 TaxID=1400762 RepID=A0A9P5XF76_9AGAR|nr:nucleic acid-binding protein [Macrolepiota fuliginosa MF-IS2]
MPTTMLTTDPLTPGGISTLAALSYEPEETQVTVQVQEELSCSWHCAISDGTHWLPAVWGNWTTHFTIDGHKIVCPLSGPPMIMRIIEAGFHRGLGIVFIHAVVFVAGCEDVIGHAKKLPIEIDPHRHYPIAKLQHHWKCEPSLWPIRALVTYKSKLDEEMSHGGSPPFFMLHLLDETGEIRAHADNQIARELYDRFEEGKVYWISNANVAYNRYCPFYNLSHAYKIVFTRMTQIEECHETINIPALKFDFVPLSQLRTAPEDSIWDIIAVVIRIGPLETTKNSKTHCQLFKRSITIADKDETISATLWANRAEEFSISIGTAVAFRHVKVANDRDGAGPALTVLSTSTVHVEPQMEEATALRQWYATTLSSTKKRKRQNDDA